jgi:splicing factor 1
VFANLHGQGDAASEPKKEKKSRWSTAEPKAALPLGATLAGLNPMLMSMGLMRPQVAMNPEQQKEYAEIQQKLVELEQKMLSVDIPVTEEERERSPSPPPVYDSLGKRTNMRPQRKREKLMKERATLLERQMQLNPALAGSMKPTKRTAEKILIPVADYPEINFMGLIIGPRGNTQKRMEQETGCKISIRGKGAHDKKARREGRVDPDENEPLHVLITCSQGEEGLDKCADMIRKLLNPKAENLEEHKAKQLRELASINGTVSFIIIATNTYTYYY